MFLQLLEGVLLVAGVAPFCGPAAHPPLEIRCGELPVLKDQLNDAAPSLDVDAEWREQLRCLRVGERQLPDGSGVEEIEQGRTDACHSPQLQDQNVVPVTQCQEGDGVHPNRDGVWRQRLRIRLIPVFHPDGGEYRISREDLRWKRWRRFNLFVLRWPFVFDHHVAELVKDGFLAGL